MNTSSHLLICSSSHPLESFIFAGMKILIIDNYDSFTFNLFHLVEELIPAKAILRVFRNDQIKVGEVGRYDKFIVSPGPGMPAEAGITCEAIEKYAPEKSILGVCLGHQAITRVFGGQLKNLDKVLHGVAVPVKIVRQDALLFRNCPEIIETGRYHSWFPDPTTFPDVLQVTAIDQAGHIMALQHKNYRIHGVQFHPESIMTPYGRQILRNWLEE
ncbi:MAG TPA: aminodeoxychorismate/anthranilate synthase component II [Bacteroidales bacterium]|nr:aminodeoxychorismate/anthranilate synthase component II [Bacteroidales bacterium]